MYFENSRREFFIFSPFIGHFTSLFYPCKKPISCWHPKRPLALSQFCLWSQWLFWAGLTVYKILNLHPTECSCPYRIPYRKGSGARCCFQGVTQASFSKWGSCRLCCLKHLLQEKFTRFCGRWEATWLVDYKLAGKVIGIIRAGH